MHFKANLKTFFYIFGGLILVILVLSISGLLLVETGWLKNKLKDLLVKRINNAIPASLYMGEITGNLYSGLTIHHAYLVMDQDTLAGARSISLRYHSPALLKHRISIESLVIDSLLVKVKKSRDGDLNWDRLKSGTPGGKQKASSGFPWAVDLKLECKDGRFVVNFPGDSLLANMVLQQINFNTAFNMNSDSLGGSINDFRFQYPDRDFELQDFECTFSGNPDSLHLAGLALHTDTTHITGDLDLDLKKGLPHSLNVNLTPLSITEVQKFVRLPLKPLLLTGETHYTLKSGVHRANVSLSSKDQQVHLTGEMNNSAGQPEYELDLETERIRLQDWVQLPPALKETRINAEIKAAGTGSNWENATFTMQTRFYNSILHGYDIDDLGISATKSGKNLRLNLDQFKGPADLAFNGRVNWSDTIRYVFDLGLDHLTIDNIPNSDNINFTLHNKGYWSRFRWQNRFTLNADSMQIAGVPVSRVNASGAHTDRTVTLDSLCIRSPLGVLDLAGVLDFDKHLDLVYQYKGGELAGLYPQLPITFDGTIQGRVRGKADSLALSGIYDLAHIEMDSTGTIEHANGQYDFSLNEKDPDGNATLYANDIIFKGRSVDSVSVQAGYRDKNMITGRIGLLANDSTKFHTDAKIVLADTTSLYLDSLRLRISNEEWNDVGIPVTIQKLKDTWYFRHVALQSGAQQIRLNGEFAPDGASNLELNIDSLAIRPVTALFIPKHRISGLLGARINITGTGDRPRGLGTISLDSAKVDRWQLGRFEGNFNLANMLCNWEMRYNQKGNRVLNLDGVIPLQVKTNGPADTEGTPLTVHAKSSDLDLGFVNVLLPVTMNISGGMELDMNYKRLDQAHNLNGYFKLNKARVVYSDLNSSLDNLDLELHIDDNRAGLSLASVKNVGTLTGKGSFELSEKLTPQNMNIDFDIQNYRLANSKKLSLLTNGNLNLAGSLEQPELTGTANIREAKIYLPAFQSKGNKSIQGPILAEKLPSVQIAQTNGNKTSSPILEQLEAQVKVIFDRNMWIRNEDMNIELSGNLDIIKSSDGIRYFGEINVVRGMLNLYGKRFDIDKGQITLQGTKEINPTLDIQASHNFRDIYSEKHNLIVKIAGNTNTPQITFELDDESIDQTNAVSFLLFGRRINELSYGEKKQMVENSGLFSSSGIENWVTSRLTAPVTRSIQNRLDLDVIEFKGGSDWRQASIVMGKYITTDLYLSYLQEFNLGRSHELATEQISLEYEINRHLFLQATKGDDKTTGVDVIIKFEK